MLLDKDKLEKNIESIAQYDFDNQKVFGTAYAVIQDNDIIYKKYFGYMSVDKNTRVTDETIFRLASMTKPITAFAILILVDRGEITLSDKVSYYLPEFEHIHIIQVDDNGNNVDLGETSIQPTIRDLLTHTSGIEGWEYAKSENMTDEEKSSIENSIKFLTNAGLDFEPLSMQSYSGFGAFDVLAKIIEKTTGIEYGDFLQREIFEPCGMKNTMFIPTEEQWNNIIEMHGRVDGKSIVVPMKENCMFDDFPCTHCLGGAGLASTLTDYLQFAQMLLNKGVIQGQRLISEETFMLLPVPYVSEVIMPGSERWGLGVRVIVDDEYKDLPIGAFGWSGAYGTHFWIDPTNHIAAVYMKNSAYDGGASNESARNFEKAVNNSFFV